MMSNMAGTKRARDSKYDKSAKKAKLAENTGKPTSTLSKTKDEGGHNGTMDGQDGQSQKNFKAGNSKEHYRPNNYDKSAKPNSYLNESTGTSSREAHIKQKALAQDRKAAKPHADSIARSKKIWERLRRKSHVPKEERDTLVKELFEIISGRVTDFVFKHDSVRVIQCALKYATPEQRRQIAGELKGHYRDLAESKYAKFLIAKMVVGDDTVRDAIVEEFYGHVKRLVRHPEASWIVDDIYRGIATKQQKAVMLREWYGPEFVVFNKTPTAAAAESPTAELSEILVQNPEKRAPIMQHLKEMTNHLVQKKTTGFTILHDALLQYFLNCKPGSPEITEFLEMLRDDEEGDCYKNLAFTRSGSRLVCLALAHEGSKGRRTILKFFKTHIRLMAEDLYGHTVLLTAYDVIDDTVMTGKAIFPELLSRDLDAEARDQALIGLCEHLTGRVPLLYLMSAEPPKWLLTDDFVSVRQEIHEIRKESSKKESEIRRKELLKQISQPLLDLIAAQAPFLAQSSFGCQFMTETFFGAMGDANAALAAVASFGSDDSEEVSKSISTPAVGRMLKALVHGGRFDKVTQTIVKTEPPLKFHNLLYEQIKSRGDDEIVNWANGPNSFVVVAMLEADDFEHKDGLLAKLKANKNTLNKEIAGARIILEKITGESVSNINGGEGEAKKGSKKRKSKSNDDETEKIGTEEAKPAKGKKEKKGKK